eukprot:Nitzschia sp. Nitz4//scaffold72_size95085//18070//19503//NITZ4_004747-RA/size95085-processed-gene-0.7-mRNA-1//1//CDS//3329557336//2157//frame0
MQKGRNKSPKLSETPPPSETLFVGDCDKVIMDPDHIESDDQGDTSTTPNTVDSLLAREMAALSTVDRENIYYDIHGVAAPLEESAEKVRNCLQELDLELAGSKMNKVAYKLAMDQDPAYVQSSEFRLRFLRSCRFDVKQSAKRFILHFKLKYELFGKELLTKDITQEDLNQEDLDALYNTLGFSLPDRDPAGRLVIVLNLRDVAKHSVQAIIRKSFYAFMAASLDVLTQQKGAISVNYISSNEVNFETFSKRREISRRYGDIVAAAPMRLEAMHVCTDSYIYRPVVAIFKLTANAFHRFRVREHFGDQKSILFSLQTFGIPIEPYHTALSEGNTEINKELWVNVRIIEEEAKKERDDSQGHLVLENPTEFDVLLGRGKSVYSHSGNLYLRNLVMEHAEQYDQAAFLDKKRVAGVIVNMIKARTGRFLRQDGVGWSEVDDDAARKKVAHSFRTFRSLTTPDTIQDVRKRARDDHPNFP